jgi:hypothetical protein
MENAPTMRFLAQRVQPEYANKYYKWEEEAYHPLLITLDEIQEINVCHLLRKTPQYPQRLRILHYLNRYAQLNLRKNQKYIDISKDVTTTFGGRIEAIWMCAYEQVNKFKNTSQTIKGKNTSESSVAPIIHLEGYSLPRDEQEKFEMWFAKWGNEIFIPMLMKLPGLTEYTFYKLFELELTGLGSHLIPKHPVEYPLYVSYLIFENVEAYEKYEESPELASLRYALQLTFPGGLDFKWYVQYQLIKSWRK